MNRFELLRYERGLTQSDVSEGTGVSRPTLARIESGARPTAPVAKKLADFYELSVVDLLGLEEAA